METFAAVKEHFELVVVGIIGVSLLPIAWGFVSSRIRAREGCCRWMTLQDSDDGCEVANIHALTERALAEVKSYSACFGVPFFTTCAVLSSIRSIVARCPFIDAPPTASKLP